MGIKFDFRYWTKRYEKDYHTDVKNKYPIYVDENDVEHKEESPYFGEISKVLQKRGFLLKKEFVSIGYWKAPRQIRNLRINSKNTIERVTKKVMDENSEEKQVAYLIDNTLKGVKIPVASALLTVLYPTKYCVIDYRAWRALKWLKILASNNQFVMESYTQYSNYLDSLSNYKSKSIYFKFLKTLRNMAKRRKMTARQLEMALWKFDKMKGEKEK